MNIDNHFKQTDGRRKPTDGSNQEPLLVPEPPIECTSGRCDNPAEILILRVRRADGSLYANAAHKLLHNGRLPQGLTFQKWIGRCVRCFTDDLEREGKLQIQQEHKPPMSAAPAADGGR